MPSIINILESIIKINMEFKLDSTMFVSLGPVFIEPGNKRNSIAIKIQLHFLQVE